MSFSAMLTIKSKIRTTLNGNPNLHLKSSSTEPDMFTLNRNNVTSRLYYNFLEKLIADTPKTCVAIFTALSFWRKCMDF